MLRWLYSRLILLHPEGFRVRFGDEMLEMFADAPDWKERVPLLGDGFVSLIRQWGFRPEFRRPIVAAGNIAILRMAESHNPSPMALFHGVLLSLISFTGVAGIIGERIPPRLIPVRLQVTPPSDFDAVSIKRSPAAKYQRVEMAFLPGGRFRAASAPMFLVMATAYDIPWQSLEVAMQQIKGSPSWMMDEVYDISAVSRPISQGTTAKARNARLKLMLQNMLADRLKLRLRVDRPETEVYALTVGSKGPRMVKSELDERACPESLPFGPLRDPPPTCHQILGGMGRGLRAAGVDMSDLAHYVSNWSDLPVVNETGLPGLYAFQTGEWRATGVEGLPDLAEILGRLGLKLTRKKARFEILVIEHVERPSEN